MEVELTNDEAHFIECAIQKERFSPGKLQQLQHSVLHKLRGEQKHQCARCSKLEFAYKMVNNEYHDGDDWYCRTPCWEDLDKEIRDMEGRIVEYKKKEGHGNRLL